MAKAQTRKRAVMVLNPSESKRLIGRAVAKLPEVKSALKSGRLIIGHGTTNAYVAEELLGRKVSKWRYAAGVVAEGRLGVTEGNKRMEPIALKRGKAHKAGWVALLKEFRGGDVFVKGGNALDAQGHVGVLLANPMGGTVGQMYGVVAARGAHLIAPVGLEKLVPDVVEAARHCGTTSTDLTEGIASGMAVLSGARVVTELEALRILFGVEAWHLASGGICGSEGAVCVAVEGASAAVARAFRFAQSLSGEPPVVRD